LARAFEAIWQEASQRKVTLRTAAYMIAIRRVHRAAQLAGVG
jgi:glutamate dehydrogenase (NAD(P)+)